MCQTHGIEHRLTKPSHPSTNGQVERMNRTIKEATVQHYHYEATIGSVATSMTSSGHTISADD
jgi:transposase InsO family protein